MRNLLTLLNTIDRLKHLETVQAVPAKLAGGWREIKRWAVFLLLASSMAFAGPPKSLIVNRTRWQIVRQPEVILKSGRYQGYTSCDKHVIQIVDDLGRCFEAV